MTEEKDFAERMRRRRGEATKRHDEPEPEPYDPDDYRGDVMVAMNDMRKALGLDPL